MFIISSSFLVCRKETFTLNPNAKAFTFNPNAKEFVPLSEPSSSTASQSASQSSSVVSPG